MSTRKARQRAKGRQHPINQLRGRWVRLQRDVEIEWCRVAHTDYHLHASPNPSSAIVAARVWCRRCKRHRRFPTERRA
jgi:hypothetical protein